MDVQRVYVLMEGVDPVWCYMVIFIDYDKAIEASKKHPDMVLEIFDIEKNGEFLSTHTFFRDGVLYDE